MQCDYIKSLGGKTITHEGRDYYEWFLVGFIFSTTPRLLRIHVRSQFLPHDIMFIFCTKIRINCENVVCGHFMPLRYCIACVTKTYVYKVNMLIKHSSLFMPHFPVTSCHKLLVYPGVLLLTSCVSHLTFLHTTSFNFIGRCISFLNETEIWINYVNIYVTEFNVVSYSSCYATSIPCRCIIGGFVFSFRSDNSISKYMIPLLTHIILPYYVALSVYSTFPIQGPHSQIYLYIKITVS